MDQNFLIFRIKISSKYTHMFLVITDNPEVLVSAASDQLPLLVRPQQRGHGGGQKLEVPVLHQQLEGVEGGGGGVVQLELGQGGEEHVHGDLEQLGHDGGLAGLPEPLLCGLHHLLQLQERLDIRRLKLGQQLLQWSFKRRSTRWFIITENWLLLRPYPS